MESKVSNLELVPVNEGTLRVRIQKPSANLVD